MAEVFKTLTREEAKVYMHMWEDGNNFKVLIADKTRNSTVVDIGCGKGIKIKELYNRDRYIGLDISEALLCEARSRNPGFVFLNVNCTDLSIFNNNTFDYSIIIGVLEHCDTLEEARSIYREGLRICRHNMFVFWHTPPKGDTNNIIEKISDDLGKFQHSNQYSATSFSDIGKVESKIVDGKQEIWTITKN